MHFNGIMEHTLQNFTWSDEGRENPAAKMMGPEETAKKFMFVNVLSETTVWCCYHLFYDMDCAYQLFLPEKINTCAVLLLKTRREGFLRDEGSILGFVSLRDIGLISILNSQSAYCIGSLLSRRVLSVFHVGVYSSTPKGCDEVVYHCSSCTHSVRGYTNRSLFQTHSYQEMVNLERFECVCPHIQWKNVMKRECKYKIWSERSENKLWPFTYFKKCNLDQGDNGKCLYLLAVALKVKIMKSCTVTC